jgi:Lrp/AsnC family leucine-responsive transcriptional regulator
MDAIDLKLISLLQKNARVPLKQLAEQVFLSSPATAARIERLEKEGIITGYTVRVNHKKLGFPITAFINLEMHPQDKPDFYPFISAHPNVLECSCVTGPYSMIIKVAFASTEELDTFINQLQIFGNTQTQIVFSTAKCISGVDIGKIEAGEYPDTPVLKK